MLVLSRQDVVALKLEKYNKKAPHFDAQPLCIIVWKASLFRNEPPAEAIFLREIVQYNR